eukprot:4238668-Amphidinium_carterae.1
MESQKRDAGHLDKTNVQVALRGLLVMSRVVAFRHGDSGLEERWGSCVLLRSLAWSYAAPQQQLATGWQT